MKRLAFILIPLLAGCASTPDPSAEIDADSLYRWGDHREELEAKHGRGRIVFVGESIPDDTFAAAIMREMVSLGKPRPSSYEIFLRHNLGTGGGYFSDYVFFNDLNRVVYVARRLPNPRVQ